jgi:hypothetical protein
MRDPDFIFAKTQDQIKDPAVVINGPEENIPVVPKAVVKTTLVPKHRDDIKPEPVPKQQDEVKIEPEVVINENDEINTPKTDPNCSEELKSEITALLADDEKNIIGLQYELTVLKMAVPATGSKTNSTKGVVRQQSKKIAAIDDGVINKMNLMYKKHGMKEDAAAISSNLKQKSSTASYFAKDKRFLNKDSSAFLMVYQGINENSEIKDSDISVLWFMDQVSEKTKSQSGKYSAVTQSNKSLNKNCPIHKCY